MTKGGNAPETRLASALPATAPAAAMAAIATGRSFLFWAICLLMPSRVWAVVTAGVTMSHWAHAMLRRERLCELTTSSLISGAARSIGLLYREATTKGASDSSVAASDSADVTRGGTNAVEIIGHLHVDREVLSLSLRETVCAGNVVGDLELDEAGCCVASHVEIALVGTSAICIDLVDGDSELGALLDSRNLFGYNSLLGFASNIDVAINLCPAARVDNVLRNLAVSDDGGVLLARADASAVTSKGVVDLETLAHTSLANGRLNCSMGMDGREHSG